MNTCRTRRHSVVGMHGCAKGVSRKLAYPHGGGIQRVAIERVEGENVPQLLQIYKVYVMKLLKGVYNALRTCSTVPADMVDAGDILI